MDEEIGRAGTQQSSSLAMAGGMLLLLKALVVLFFSALAAEGDIEWPGMAMAVFSAAGAVLALAAASEMADGPSRKSARMALAALLLAVAPEVTGAGYALLIGEIADAFETGWLFGMLVLNVGSVLLAASVLIAYRRLHKGAKA